MLVRKINSVLTTLPDMPDMVPWEATGNNHKLDNYLKKYAKNMGQSHLCAAMDPNITTIKCRVGSNPTRIATPSQLMCMLVS